MSLCFGNIFIVNHLAGALLRTISMEIWTHYNSLKTQIKPLHHIHIRSSSSEMLLDTRPVSRLWSNKPYSKNLCSARHNNQYHNEGFCDFTSHSVQALSGQNKNLTFLSYLHLIRVMANTGSRLTDSEDAQNHVLRGWKYKYGCCWQAPHYFQIFPPPQ